MKGLFKGFKNMFSPKEHEMEIGFPTEVKHVSHIGWDNASEHAPSWMKEFQTAAGYTTASLSNMANVESPWLNREPESTRSLSKSFSVMRNHSTSSSREEGKPSKKIRCKKKGKTPSSPGSISASSYTSTSHIKTKTKIKNSNFRSCGADMEGACMANTNPYQKRPEAELVPATGICNSCSQKKFIMAGAHQKDLRAADEIQDEGIQNTSMKYKSFKIHHHWNTENLI